MHTNHSISVAKPVLLPRRRGEPTVIVPVASGFDEELTVLCVSKLRSQDKRVWLASETGGNVRGRYGLTIAVDKRIDNLRGLHSASKVLLTGGKRSLHAVLRLESMRTLLAQLAAVGGTVITTREAVATVDASGLMKSLQHLSWHSQDWESLPELIDQVGMM